MALMSFTETVAAGRAFAAAGEPSPRPNRELLATGLANAGGAFLGSHAGRRRHVADRGQPPGGSADPARGDGDRGRDRSRRCSSSRR